ncbi:MAG: leucine-rich repeat protein [Tannerella sp.]|jgi:hypothetical protein|nr:leucine-rich repeat protein [Tannerella sp.]
MIEKGTIYSFMLEAGEPLNFQKIKDVSDQFILNLSKDLQEKLFEMLEPDVLMLDSEPLMAAHLYAVGEVQEARLKHVYSYFPKSFFNKEIELIDYGCGQGIAEIVYNDFLGAKKQQQKIRRITLIDPSEIAIKRAALHAKLIFPDVEIRMVCENLEKLKPKDILSEKKTTKLHLLVDFPRLNTDALVHISKVIKANLSGPNYFLCIGPYQKKYSDLLEQLDLFIEMMNPDQKLRHSEDLDVNQFVSGKPWTCSLRTFVKNEAKDGKIVTEKNIKYRLTRDGIKYSADMAILVKCPSSIEGEYILPYTITSIESKAFRGCEKMSVIDADNFNFISKDGVLYSHDMSRLIKYPQAKAATCFEIPDGVLAIEPYAFSGCVLLEEIILPETLTVLGFGAFEYCIQLKNIIIPESVTKIEGSVFASCKSLSTVDFNPICCESMENIETDSEGISCREALAFEGCTSLTTIWVGENVTVIPDFAFSFCEYISTIILPESVVYIGRNSFSYCKQLEKIIFTKSIRTIGKDAFFWCKNLRTILIPAGMSLFFKEFIALKDFETCIREEISNEENKMIVIAPQKEGAILSNAKEIINATDQMQKVDEFDDYISRLHKLADQGNLKIQNKLGYLYEVGEKVAQNSIEAVKWYRMAAEQGYAMAQFNLANQYALGRGVEKNELEASKWYLEAANQGIVDAMNNLGAMYAMGHGVELDETKAIEWYYKAAEKGNKTAIRNLQKRGIDI